MGILATTFVAAQPHLTQGAEFTVLMICAIAGLVLMDRAGVLPEDTRTRKRVLYALAGLLVVVSLFASVTHAVTIIDCGEHITWLEWIFWYC